MQEPEEDEFDDDEENDEETNDENLPEVFDLSEVPDQPEFEVVPPGIYDGVIDHVEYGLSKSSGNPMLTWVVKCEIEGRTQTFWYHTTLAGNGFSRTKRTLLRLDPELDLTEFRPGDANEMFEQMECRVKVGIQPSRDDPKTKQNTVKELLAADEDGL